MNKDNIQKLVDALKSGEYTKTEGKLKKALDIGDKLKSDCYCTKGVACEIYRKETGKGYWSDLGFTIQDPDGLTTDKYGFVYSDIDEIDISEADIDWPQEVRDWYGVTSEFGNDRIGENTVEYYNDDLELSFTEIADLIESNWINESNVGGK